MHNHARLVMDITHQEHLLKALHRVLNVAGLVACILAEVFTFATGRHAASYIIPLCAILLVYGFRRRGGAANNTSIYMIEFSCLTPPRQLRAPIPSFVEHLKLIGFERDAVEFMGKAVEASGMGNETYLPAPLHFIPPEATHGNALEEARTLLFPTLDELFAKTGVPPSAIGALVVSCSGFCPAPSLTAIIANHYRMRSDVKTFNVSGMGCSGGVIGVDIARNILITHADTISYAIVVCTEVVTVGWYNGREHSKLLLNCFFRTGCAAALLTNNSMRAATTVPAAKYRLVRLVRTNRIADDEGYHSGYREEDDEGITGFNIRRGVGSAFEAVLRAHLVTLGVSILPWKETLRYAKAAILRSLLLHLQISPEAAGGNNNNNQLLTPSFRRAADHFCLPTTWRPMIRRLGKGLGLGDKEMEAALMTFHRFGNQSAASLWYQLAYLEAKGKVRKGDKVWQLGVGTGLKVNSVLWERVIHATDHLDDDDLAAGAGPWRDCIHRYPVPE